VSEKLDCPILALGGAGSWQHILDLFLKTNISAACTQNIFHFTEESILSAKKFLKNSNIKIRN
jgi:cyclase